MIGYWVTCCIDLSAGFVTYMKVSVEADERGTSFILKKYSMFFLKVKKKSQEAIQQKRDRKVTSEKDFKSM